MNCPKCNNDFKLTKWQDEFIKSAIIKKMKFIMLECQKCKQYFQFNPLQNKVIENTVPAKKPDTIELSKEEMVEKMKIKKIVFPKTYEDFLLSLQEPLHMTINKKEWKIYTLTNLFNKTSIDGKTCISAQELSVFARTLKTFNKSDYTHDDKGNLFSLSRLSKGISIGEENGDVLFLDPTDGYSLRCFYHDGGEVQLLEAKFDVFFKKLEKKFRLKIVD